MLLRLVACRSRPTCYAKAITTAQRALSTRRHLLHGPHVQMSNALKLPLTMEPISLFMVGDVMLARGVDMIQKHSCDPTLYEGNNLNAYDYVALAEEEKGKLPDESERGVDYTWGYAIKALEEKKPDVRIINLETSITTSKTPWPHKGIHYKMHPQNVNVIQAAKIDCCMLGNNHTADWGYEGLMESLDTLKAASIEYVGAGRTAQEAAAPAIFNLPGKGRVLVFGVGHCSSGIPPEWRAGSEKAGVRVIDLHNPGRAVSELKDQIKQYKTEGDIVVLSIHWGGNWGWDIEQFQSKFAHAIVKEAQVDIVHGHSSHHVQGVEVYKGKLIIYGCGDFLNDYEGIRGKQEYRGDLSLMYFADVDPASGKLVSLRMVPTEIKHLRVNRTREGDTTWMAMTMARECKKLGTDIKRKGEELHLVFNK